MSWFADFAGKAEDFLNKVDQGAASALSKSHATTSFSSACKTEPMVEPEYSSEDYKSNQALAHQTYASFSDAPGFISEVAGNIRRSNMTSVAGTAFGSESNLSNTSKGSGCIRSRKSEQDLDDDMLFDFLNNSDPPDHNRREFRREHTKLAVAFTDSQNSTPHLSSTPHPLPSAPSTPPSTRGVSRASSMSSLSNHSNKTYEESSAKEQTQDSLEMAVNLDSGLAVPTDSIKQEAPPTIEEPQSQVLSSLRLENQLLRSEVASLNQEMASVIMRAKPLQDELNQARLHADRWNAEQCQTDRTLRELRSHVDDLTEALSAKDGQLAVLKVRLDEADQLLKSRNAALEEIQSEKSRILLNHTEGSNMQSQALEAIQERLQEAELALRREKDSYRQMQNEYAARLSKVEGERQTLAETVTAAERRTAEEKIRADTVQQQVKNAKAATESAKQELQDYKHKASRILQSKEKLISSLKEGSGMDCLHSHSTVALEVEELRHEKELQREEIHKLQGLVTSLRTEIQDLENQALTETEIWREQQLQFHEQQTLQNRAKMDVEADLERCKQELLYVEDEHHRAKASLQSRIKDRDDEIQKLRNQLTNKKLSSSSEIELENRLHQLTETLIQKQTMLEALGSEKSSLVFQLERLELQLKSAQGGQSGAPAINMSTLEGPGARQRNTPVLFSDHDTPGVYGKVRKAASTIDRFSIRLGIFLRRYPMARLFVIVYMAILHLWVMIVLLTYTPEIHSHPNGS